MYNLRNMTRDLDDLIVYRDLKKGPKEHSNDHFGVDKKFQTAMASRVLWPVLLACVSPVLMYPSGAPGCSNGGPSDFSPSHGTTVNDPILPYTVNATKSGKDWTDYKITTSLPPTIVPDSECGSTKGCQSDCNTGTCSYQVTWKRSGDLVRFEFQQLLGTGNKYQAVGLSNDSLMGNDSVMICKSSADVASFEQGTNSPGPGSYYASLRNPNDVRTIETSQADGVIKCVVERPITSNDSNVFPLTESWYLLHAIGPVVPGGYVVKHTATTSTQNKVDLLTANQPPPPSGIGLDPDCGVSKGCQFSCSGDSCSYLLTWQVRDDLVRFEMMEALSGNNYQAMGFSSDNKMLTGTGVSVIETSYTSGVVRCVIDRPINSTNNQVFSLTRNWYLLRASGPVSGGSLSTHRSKTSSSSTVDFLSASLVTEAEADLLMVKLHGSFMMIAWVMFSSIGIVTARFFKGGWEGKTLGGIKVWFQIHRTCMVSVFVLTVAAFVIIFIDVGEYREVAVSDGRDYLRYHPVLGIVVTALTVINPIMSLFRCGPDDKRRPIFNIAHFLVGTGAHILAAITVLFGMNIDRSNVSMDASYVMYAYMATFVAIELAFELQRICEKSFNSSNDVAIEMKSTSEKSEKSIQFEKRPAIKKETFLYIHMLLMIAFCVAMVVIKIMNGHYLLVCVSIVVATEGRPDGVRGCGTSDASFIPAHGDSPHNESLPIYIRALRNGTDWSGCLSYKELIKPNFAGIYMETRFLLPWKCIFQCTLDSCSHLITWEKRGEFARFEFLADLNQLNMGLNLYQSIAFSDDKFMGNDDVMSCKSYSGDVHFELGYNLADRKSYQQIRDIHRACMVLVVTLTVTAVIAIAADVKGLSQALISVFRCPPDDRYRVVFNGVHRLFGISSHYLSIVTIMVGTQMDRSTLPPEAGAVVYTHTAVLVLFEVVHNYLRCRQDLQDKETVSISKTNDDNDSAKVPVEQVLFYTVIALCTVSSTLVVFFIIQTR
uniref:Putative ferric-chelate reductase 1 n=1 Tax=Magallana gigas TaxID=29159 RepID=K1PA49_MAGGI